ncbi:PAS domain-containing sensor histidine kinase [Brevundimonas naejangsanensis]|uniref:histidine kinase n=1 Tax=Brevundimonas naejangsanensis TaxID=588932 RepID=A0A494RD06_9CAUL|nr:ATP-binding protein [Brevundimonas naejangsanensis]AYG94175.1 PAS domain-containing sensor histidine kinase [Brevundimonas naejangsanensis]
MRGTERRRYGPGRRATDHQDARSAPWVRILALAVALALAAYVLLIARETERPRREVEAARLEALALEASLAAARIEARLARTDRALDAAARILAQTPARPVQALDSARLEDPEAAFLVAAPNGRVLAASGARLNEPQGAAGFTVGDDGLTTRRETETGHVLVARTPLPPLEPALKQAGLIVLPSGQAPAAPDLAVKGPDGRAQTAAVAPIGETGLSAVAVLPRPDRLSAWLDDAWMLAVPLLLVVLMLAVIAVQNWRQMRVGRRWADTERRFRVAVEAARCGVWEWDLAKGEAVLSDYMAALLEVETGTILTTQAMIERVHPRYRQLMVQALDEAMAGGVFEAAFPVPLRNGGVRWIDARGQSRQPRRDGGYDSLMGVALDITEARRTKAQAQAAESRLRDAIESVSDAFVLFDRRGRLILWNQGFQDAFAFPEGVVRRGALKDELNRIAAQAIKAEHPSAGGRAGVREVELKDGRWLQMAERFTGDGGVVVICADITVIRRQEAERRRAADELRAMVQELEASQTNLALLARKYEVAMTRAEAANQAKSEFLANMSHELRTPLNAINGFSEIMAGEMFGPLGDPRYKGYAADIHGSGQHLLSLINDILDMAKIEAGKLTLHYEPLALDVLCAEAVRLMRGKAQEARLALTLACPEALHIEADQRGLKQVLLNLISNAVKFTPEGGAVAVTVSPRDADTVRVSVSDTGIGIAATDLERLAQPFEQVEGQHSKSTQGTGLGLALTRSLVELHGGRLTIDSEPGHGTTVWFDLPMRAPEGAVAPIGAPARRVQSRAA